MRIFIETKPYSQMRYRTLGDYYPDAHGTKVDVADLGDWKFNFLVAMHELIEAALCQAAGIREEDVRAFDEANIEAEDPGSLPDAPYRSQHLLAERVEHFLADHIGVNWSEYEQRCADVGV